MAVTAHVLIWVAVALQLGCCLGVLVLRQPIDRLHFAGAATALGPALVAAAVCFEEGAFTTNGLNAIAVALLLALLGGGLGAATARMIRLRERGSLESTQAERERRS